MIVATAGHVDHGKTRLVKMLTGMDTDRLEEEKRRGLSINLGFAYLKTASNKTIAFVDVPGHRRFINTMIAGINGIDLAMLVVAADDGPMPQTREHMDVLKMLGVTRFILIISKIDRADKNQVERVRNNALALFPDASAVPVFKVSTPEKRGVPEIASYLENEVEKHEALSAAGYYRLSIDRAFHIKGSGLVVTGTVISGSVQAGDSLMLAPQNIPVRVRSLQLQEQDQQQAFSGQRCALNISGDIEKDDIERGDWLVDAALNQTTLRFDAKVGLLGHTKISLKHMSPVKLYVGAKRIAAQLALLDEKKLSAGQSCLAQLIVKRALHCCHGDRFLLRDDSESDTLGGGVVLDPFASKRTRSSSHLQILAAMEQTGAQAVLESLLFELRQLVNLQQFCLAWNIRADERSEVLRLASYADRIKIIAIDDVQFAVAGSHWQFIIEWLQNELETQSNIASKASGNAGVAHETLIPKFKKQFPGIEIDLVLRYMQATGTITIARDRISIFKKHQDLSATQQQLWTEIEGHLLACGLQVPVVGDLAKVLGREQSSVLALAGIVVKSRRLIIVADKRFALVEHIRQFAEKANSLAERQVHFSVAEFKNECGIGRNLAVEVLEYFDKIGFTLRKESGRVILHRDRVNKMTA